MIERKERKPYWQHTKWQMLASLIPLIGSLLVLPIYANSLNDDKILSIPVGLFLTAHGFFVIAVLSVASFVNRQDAIDHWHGAHEDN